MTTTIKTTLGTVNKESLEMALMIATLSELKEYAINNNMMLAEAVTEVNTAVYGEAKRQELKSLKGYKRR